MVTKNSTNNLTLVNQDIPNNCQKMNYHKCCIKFAQQASHPVLFNDIFLWEMVRWACQHILNQFQLSWAAPRIKAGWNVSLASGYTLIYQQYSTYDVIIVMAGQKSSLHFNRLAILSDVIIVKAGWNVSLYLNAVRALLSMMLSLSNTDSARQICSYYSYY